MIAGKDAGYLVRMGKDARGNKNDSGQGCKVYDDKSVMGHLLPSLFIPWRAGEDVAVVGITIVVSGCLCMFLHVPLCPSMSLYVSVCLLMSLCVPLCPFMSLYVSVCPFMSHYVSFCPFVSLCVSLCLFASPCPRTRQRCVSDAPATSLRIIGEVPAMRWRCIGEFGDDGGASAKH